MEVTHAVDEATLTVADATKITGLSADTIRRYSTSGKLPTFRTPANHRRFRESDVRALFTEQAPSSEPSPGSDDGAFSRSAGDAA